MKVRHKEIPTNLLREDPSRFQRETNDQWVGELCESYKDVGLIHDIVVRQKPGDEHYYIIAGMNRFRAAMDAGAKTITCKVLTACSDEIALKISLFENLHRHLGKEEKERYRAEVTRILAKSAGSEDSGEEPKVHHKGRPVSAKGKAIRKVAAAEGRSVRTIQRALEHHELAPEVRAAAREKRIQPAHVRQLAALPVDEQADALGDIISPPFRRDERLDKFSNLVAAFTRIKRKTMDRLLDEMADAPPGLLDRVDRKTITRFVQFMVGIEALLKIAPKHCCELLEDRRRKLAEEALKDAPVDHDDGTGREPEEDGATPDYED